MGNGEGKGERRMGKGKRLREGERYISVEGYTSYFAYLQVYPVSF